MSDDRARQVRVALALAALEPCLLCGAAPAVTGLFIPCDGGWHGRLAAYTICGACFEQPDLAQRVEAVLFAGRAE